MAEREGGHDSDKFLPFSGPHTSNINAKRPVSFPVRLDVTAGDLMTLCVNHFCGHVFLRGFSLLTVTVQLALTCLNMIREGQEKKYF